jgi:hypothetical protein
MEYAQIGLAGEYYVLAQLAQRGLVGALTLGHTKGVDILVSDSKYKALFRVEVKTSTKKPSHSQLFGMSLFYTWIMSEKHETIKDDRLYYCFVHMSNCDELPKFFIVPSKTVASYVRKQHRRWLNSGNAKATETKMRNFRIAVHDPDGYMNNWKAFGKTSNQAL